MTAGLGAYFDVFTGYIGVYCLSGDIVSYSHTCKVFVGGGTGGVDGVCSSTNYVYMYSSVSSVLYIIDCLCCLRPLRSLALFLVTVANKIRQYRGDYSNRHRV
jgi:hypothetical protein